MVPAGAASGLDKPGCAITEIRYPQLKASAEAVVQALVDAAVGDDGPRKEVAADGR
jgi:hypothetical protein